MGSGDDNAAVYEKRKWLWIQNGVCYAGLWFTNFRLKEINLNVTHISLFEDMLENSTVETNGLQCLSGVCRQ